jgi:biopolymer transport protein ExbD
MAMGTGGGGPNDGPGTLAEINVTPLVDVMLVLLIIFMVTASAETVRAERELERSRVERDLVPRKPEPPRNVLKDVPIVVPNTTVKEVQESEQKEPKVVLGHDLVFRLDATPIVDCKQLEPLLATAIRDGSDDAAEAAFERCARKAAGILGPNVLIQEKKRVNFAADRTIPWGWATKFLAVMGVEHGIKQVNIITTNPPAVP